MTEEERSRLAAIADPFIGQLLIQDAILAALVKNNPNAHMIAEMVDGLIERWSEKFPNYPGAVAGAKSTRDRIFMSRETPAD